MTLVAGKKTAFACIIMIAVLEFVASTNGAISRDMLFFADALHLPLVFRDIFELGGELSDWYQTPAPYWFPDFLLYLPSALLAKTNYILIAILAVVQVMYTVESNIYTHISPIGFLWKDNLMSAMLEAGGAAQKILKI
jgi:hypothetical protein